MDRVDQSIWIGTLVNACIGAIRSRPGNSSRRAHCSNRLDSSKPPKQRIPCDRAQMEVRSRTGRPEECTGEPGPLTRIGSVIDLPVVAPLSLLYYWSFELTSQVNGPDELFLTVGKHKWWS